MRYPVKPSAASESSHTIGGPINAGSTSRVRSATSSGAIMRVSAAPPGMTALTVTPVPASSPAQAVVIASSAAFDGP